MGSEQIELPMKLGVASVASWTNVHNNSDQNRMANAMTKSFFCSHDLEIKNSSAFGNKKKAS